jgi:hypothetical protein
MFTSTLSRLVVVASFLFLGATVTAIAGEPLRPGRYTVVLVNEWGDPKEFGPERIELLTGTLTKDSDTKQTLRVTDSVAGSEIVRLKLSFVAENDASGFQVHEYRGESDWIEFVGSARLANDGKPGELRGTLQGIGVQQKRHFLLRPAE